MISYHSLDCIFLAKKKKRTLGQLTLDSDADDDDVDDDEEADNDEEKDY